MPELPEVETIVRGLSDLVGAQIHHVRVFDPRLALRTNGVQGSKIEAVKRIGKYIVFRLSTDRMLIFHLRMSGRLARLCSQVEQKHVRLALDTDRGAVLFVNPRRLGTAEVSCDGFPHRLGVDPLDEAFTATYLMDVTAFSQAPIKALLMDQTKIAGIGNIYAQEVLWHAGIDPRRTGKSLTNDDVAAVFGSVKAVLSQAITKMGSSLGDSVSNYRGTAGEQGSFQNHFTVYGREGKPCPRCGETILRIKQAGRSTCLCPQCQK